MCECVYVCVLVLTSRCGERDGVTGVSCMRNGSS